MPETPALASASSNEPSIDRRQAIRRVSLMLGGATLIGESALWVACSTRERPRAGTIGAFSTADIAFLDEVAETILPQTQTPGAKAAGVGPFMALMVTDCYEPTEQQIFREGVRAVDEACRRANGTSFMSASSDQRLAVLQGLDRDQKTYTDAKQPNDPNHYFRMMKELALLGYFTSEIGCTRAQRYVESPGRYDPCTPYVPGTPAWAAHG